MFSQNYCLKISTYIVLQLFWIIVYLQNAFSSQNIPKTIFVMVWHIRLPLSSVSFSEESIHIIIICNLSNEWCIDKELNQVQGFMILISVCIIKAAFKKLAFPVLQWHFTFLERHFWIKRLGGGTEMRWTIRATPGILHLRRLFC